ncbi:hypothetical protein CA833_20235 [Novosphingobium sp. KA1]|nr:hypothetical protein CA833_20235 [Novosphingobium sp. KA1]
MARGDVPADVTDEESPYVMQLVAVFACAGGLAFANYTDVVANITYGPQMINARRRYLERQAFRRHFRDNLPASQIDNVDEDVHEGVIDRYHSLDKAPLYERLTQIMTTASTVQVTGALGRHNRVTASVKQGACHHFANVGRMPWA